MTLSGDYLISGSIEIKEPPSGIRIIIGGDGTAGDGQFTMYFSGTSAYVQYPITTGNNYDLSLDMSSLDGKLVSYSLQKVGTTITFTVGDQTDSETRGDWEPIMVSNVGRWISIFMTSYSDSIHGGFSLTDGSTLTHDLRFDEDRTSTTVVNYGTGADATAVNLTSDSAELFTDADGDWIGEELWVNPPDVIDTEWTDDGGGQYTLTGTGAFEQLRMNTGISEGAKYEVTLNIISLSANIKLQGVVNAVSFSTTGMQTTQIIADGTFLRFARVSGATNCVIKDISVKRLIEVAP